jgi:hypothetical protein
MCIRWHHDEVDGRQILRALAIERQRDIDGVEPQYRQTVILASRPILSGAMLALVRADLLDARVGQALLEDLLRPIEQPLVDTGVIKRISKSASTSVSLQVGEAEERERDKRQRHLASWGRRSLEPLTPRPGGR